SLEIGDEEDASHAEPVWGVMASSNYFDVLDVRPVIGRPFPPTVDVVGDEARVAVVSWALWQRRFAGDPAAIGRRVRVNGRELTVIGVAPRAFAGTINRLAFDVWMPATLHGLMGGDPEALEDRAVRFFEVFARLAPGATLSSGRDYAGALG